MPYWTRFRIGKDKTYLSVNGEVILKVPDDVPVRIGTLAQEDDGSWKAEAQGEIWKGCADERAAIKHLIQHFRIQQNAELQRELNRSPKALFKTTFILWSAKRPAFPLPMPLNEIVEKIENSPGFDGATAWTQLVKEPENDRDYPTKEKKP